VLRFSASNSPTLQRLCEVEIWSPPQGSNELCIPLFIDVRFDKERIRFPSFSAIVQAKRAEVTLTLDGATVVAGSRYGDDIVEPYELSDLMVSVNDLAEIHTEVELRGKLSVASLWGRVTASFRGHRKSKRERDSTLLAKVKRRRVSYSTKDCWSIHEPLPPHVLEGRYLGIRMESGTSEKVDPLLLFQVNGEAAAINVYLCIDKNDLVVSIPTDHLRFGHRNREVIINQMLNRTLPGEILGANSLPPQYNGMQVYSHSKLECSADG